jgi:hypothetical protein
MIDGGVFVEGRGTDFRDRLIEFLLKKFPSAEIVRGSSLVGASRL